MKKIIAIMVLSLLSISLYSQEDIFKEIKKYLEDKYLNPLAEDLSGIVNTASFHDAQKLKILGFDVGLRVPVKKLSSENIIVSTTTSAEYLLLPQISLELGLPANLNLIAKGLIFYNTQFLGVGLRYSHQLPVPTISVSAVGMYNTINHQYFNANGYNLNIVGSINLPVVTPYASIGYENFELKVEDMKGSYSGLKYGGGVNFSPFPFTYIYLGVDFSGRDMIYNLGLGAKFGGII